MLRFLTWFKSFFNGGTPQPDVKAMEKSMEAYRAGRFKDIEQVLEEVQEAKK